MDTTQLEFIRDNSIKKGITYPLLNREKYPYVYQVYFNDSNLTIEDLMYTLYHFALDIREWLGNHSLLVMLKGNWDTLLDALKNSNSNKIKVSLRLYDYFAYYKPLK